MIFVVTTSNATFRKPLKIAASPKSMPAVIATWPSMLNQPVNQDQAAPLRLASFADQ